MVYGKHLSAQNPYWFRAITSEPCYFEAKNMMLEIGEEAVELYKSNPFWMQYSQCHHGWNIQRLAAAAHHRRAMLLQ